MSSPPGGRSARTAARARAMGGAAQDEDPDALYARRAEDAYARTAADIWAARLRANPRDFESAWKLAQARYWLGTHGPPDRRRADLEGGVEAGRTAATGAPNRPEGHFWMAANMGALAESYGLRQGLKYRKPIREALERVLQIDAGYLGGAADRALGRWYFKVPRLFGGSSNRSVEHLRKALTYNPDSTIGHYFLAETLLDMDRADQARAELHKVLEAPFDPEWTPEDKEWKAKAQELLATLDRRR